MSRKWKDWSAFFAHPMALPKLAGGTFSFIPKAGDVLTSKKRCICANDRIYSIEENVATVPDKWEKSAIFRRE